MSYSSQNGNGDIKKMRLIAINHTREFQAFVRETQTPFAAH